MSAKAGSLSSIAPNSSTASATVPAASSLISHRGSTVISCDGDKGLPKPFVNSLIPCYLRSLSPENPSPKLVWTTFCRGRRRRKSKLGQHPKTYCWYRVVKERSICNPLTRKSLALPRAPKIKVAYFGLICESNICDKRLRCNCNIRFSVVLISVTRSKAGVIVFRAAIFRSETGQWTKSKMVRSAACNSVMHAPIGHCIVVFDPLNQPPQYRRIEAPVSMIGSAFLGSVQGRLRVSQLILDIMSRRYVKVWELNCCGGEGWALMHDSVIKTSDSASNLSVVGFHPDDGDVIFLWWGGGRSYYSSRYDSEECYNQFCQYDIAKGKIETHGELPGFDVRLMFREDWFKVLTLSHPS